MQALRSFFASEPPPPAAPAKARPARRTTTRRVQQQHIELIGGAACTAATGSGPVQGVGDGGTPTPRLPAELRLLIVAAALAELLAAPPSPARHHAVLSLALAERAALALVLAALLRTPHLRGAAAVAGLQRVLAKAPYRPLARGTRRLVVSSAPQQQDASCSSGLFSASSSAQAFASQSAAPLAGLLRQLAALDSLVLAAPPRALLAHLPPSLAQLTCAGSVYGSDVLPRLFARATPLRRLTLLGPRLYLPAATLRLLAAQPQLADVTLFLPRRDVELAVLVQSAALRSVTVVAHETRGTTGYRGGLEGALQMLTRRRAAGPVQVRLVTVRSASDTHPERGAPQEEHGSASNDQEALSLPTLEEWFFARCAQGLDSFDSAEDAAQEPPSARARAIDARFGVQCEVLQWELEEAAEQEPPPEQEQMPTAPAAQAIQRPLQPERMEALDLASSEEEQGDYRAHDYDYLE